jgi:nucleoside phosphorylase
MMSLHLIAAEPVEFSGLLPHLASVSRLPWPVDYAVQAKLQSTSVTLLANGPGPKLARQAARLAVEHSPTSSFLSTGFCGGLAPDLAVGEIVAASEIQGEDGHRYAARLPQSAARSGVIYSGDRVACTVAEKEKLHRSGAVAVEMEAAAVAAVAAAAGRDFYCIRVVSDTANDELPIDFNRYRDAAGRFDRKRIALAAVLHPFRRVPGLLRLQRNCSLAACKLGEFLANCRF